MSPVPAVGIELTPCSSTPGGPWGCLPRSEQILRSIQLLKESFCCYSAFLCICGAVRGLRHPPPVPEQGLDVPRDMGATGGRLLCPSL